MKACCKVSWPKQENGTPVLLAQWGDFQLTVERDGENLFLESPSVKIPDSAVVLTEGSQGGEIRAAYPVEGGVCIEVPPDIYALINCSVRIEFP